jgi:hypothetical protein
MYADAVIARNFEKLPLGYNFSQKEMEKVANVGKWL